MNSPGELVQRIAPWERRHGTPGPPGVTTVPVHNAWHVAIDSRHATAVTVFEPGREKQRDPATFRVRAWAAAVARKHSHA